MNVEKRGRNREDAPPAARLIGTVLAAAEGPAAAISARANAGTDAEPEPPAPAPKATLTGRTLPRGMPSGIAQRLERKFGLGTNKPARRKLYLMLEAAVEQHGDAAYQAISEAVAQAVAARGDPGRYFARAVKLKLADRGLVGRADADASW